MALYRMKSKYGKKVKVLSYHGTTDDLSTYATQLAAASTPDYALFGGGYGGSPNTGNNIITMLNEVTAYSKSLVKNYTNPLQMSRRYLSATSVGNYALFGGGYYSGSSPQSYKYVDAYNNSLSRSTPAALSAERHNILATSVGNYALFGGGYQYGTGNKKVVDTYNKSLTRGSATAFNNAVGCDSYPATSVGNYAIFFGTNNAYNKSLTKTNITNCSPELSSAAASDGKYAIIAGGTKASAYDSSLTLISVSALSQARIKLQAISLGDYTIFSSGSYGSNFASVNVTDIYINLVRSIIDSLSNMRMYYAATSVGDYALFGGGSDYYLSNFYKKVDVYQIA